MKRGERPGHPGVDGASPKCPQRQVHGTRRIVIVVSMHVFPARHVPVGTAGYPAPGSRRLLRVSPISGLIQRDLRCGIPLAFVQGI
jgi:hypothetical protein